LVKDERGIFEHVSSSFPLLLMIETDDLCTLGQLGIPYLEPEQRNYRTYQHIIPRHFF
jgi:hypothetical protein